MTKLSEHLADLSVRAAAIEKRGRTVGNLLRNLIPAIVVSLSFGQLALGAEPPVDWDGLQKAKIKGIDIAYVRPGVNLAQYSKVMLDPVQVAFAKDWKPDPTASQPSQADRERIKNELASLATDSFKGTLNKNNGYPVVATPGPDVMRLSTTFVDVYVAAPKVRATGSTKSGSFVMTNAGHMTLVAELRDSETGALFARVLDEKQARDKAATTMSTSVDSSAENSAEARNAVNDWAKILRAQLDAVRAHPSSH